MAQGKSQGLFDDPIFRRFAVERPIATSVQLTLGRLIEPTTIDKIFDQHAEAQYERKQTFSATRACLSLLFLGLKSEAVACRGSATL